MKGTIEYYCPHCDKVILRTQDESKGRKWIDSFCETSGRNVRIQIRKINPPRTERNNIE
jgi:hypothetical protein